MKNAISRRSFLKAVGIMSAAGALAAVRRQVRIYQHGSFCCCFHCRFRLCIRRKHQAWTYPIGGWGKDETVQELIASSTQSILTLKWPLSISTTPTAMTR